MLRIEMFTEKDVQRYYKYIPKNQPNELCWNWLGCLVTGGYGSFAAFNLVVGKRQQIGAHRFTALLKYRTISDGVYAMHKCDNPKCCNPLHIELGDCRKNTKDAVNRGLLKPVKGERHGRAKLTETDVRYILLMYGKIKTRELAEKFSIDKNTIYDIMKGRKWKHISNLA